MVLLTKFSRYFLEVIHHGSIRKAAEHLNIAASAVDRQILNVEETLGVRLFDRVSGGVRLTAAGEAVFHQLTRWGKEEAALHRHLAELKNARGGEVRIAVADGLAVSFIPSVIMLLHDDSPGLRFKVTVATAATAAILLRAGDCDLGVTFDPPSFAGLSVEAEALSRLGVLVPRNHPLTHMEDVRVTDCTGYPIVAPDSSTTLWRLVKELLEETDMPYDIVFNSNNIALVCDMVKKNLGIAIMRDLDAFGHYNEDEAQFIELNETKLATQKLSLIIPKTRVLSPSAHFIIEKFKKIFQGFDNNPQQLLGKPRLMGDRLKPD